MNRIFLSVEFVEKTQPRPVAENATLWPSVRIELTPRFEPIPRFANWATKVYIFTGITMAVDHD